MGPGSEIRNERAHVTVTPWVRSAAQGEGF